MAAIIVAGDGPGVVTGAGVAGKNVGADALVGLEAADAVGGEAQVSKPSLWRKESLEFVVSSWVG